MQSELLKVFQLEVAKQCRWATLAIEDVETALKNLNERRWTTSYGMNRLWMAIQTFLVAVGNISKLLWPNNPKIPDRGTELRASLGVKDDSCLEAREFRNHFEHFDDRLEQFFLSLQPPTFYYIDSNVSPGGIKSLAPSVNPELVLRHFDPESWEIIFRGEKYQLEPLFKAILELLEKAERESEKR